MHNAAFSLPAATSAAWADEPHITAISNIPTGAIRIITSLRRHCRARPGNPSLLQDVFVLMDARIKSGHDARALDRPFAK
jgi:hypothetical protein